MDHPPKRSELTAFGLYASVAKKVTRENGEMYWEAECTECYQVLCTQDGKDPSPVSSLVLAKPGAISSTLDGIPGLMAPWRVFCPNPKCGQLFTQFVVPESYGDDNSSFYVVITVPPAGGTDVEIPVCHNTDVPDNRVAVPFIKDEDWRVKCPTCDEVYEIHPPQMATDFGPNTKCPKCGFWTWLYAGGNKHKFQQMVETTLPKKTFALKPVDEKGRESIINAETNKEKDNMEPTPKEEQKPSVITVPYEFKIPTQKNPQVANKYSVPIVDQVTGKVFLQCWKCHELFEVEDLNYGWRDNGPNYAHQCSQAHNGTMWTWLWAGESPQYCKKIFEQAFGQKGAEQPDPPQASVASDGTVVSSLSEKGKQELVELLAQKIRDKASEKCSCAHAQEPPMVLNLKQDRCVIVPTNKHPDVNPENCGIPFKQPPDVAWYLKCSGCGKTFCLDDSTVMRDKGPNFRHFCNDGETHWTWVYSGGEVAEKECKRTPSTQSSPLTPKCVKSKHLSNEAESHIKYWASLVVEEYKRRGQILPSQYIKPEHLSDEMRDYLQDLVMLKAGCIKPWHIAEDTKDFLLTLQSHNEGGSTTGDEEDKPMGHARRFVLIFLLFLSLLSFVSVGARWLFDLPSAQPTKKVVLTTKQPTSRPVHNSPSHENKVETPTLFELPLFPF